MLYIILLLILVIDPYIDHKWAALNREIDHARHALLAAIVFCVVLWIWSYATRAELYEIAGHIIMILGIRWNLHDAVFNLLRKKPLDYIGDGINDSKTDKLLKRIPLNPFFVKLLFLFACIAATILLYSYEWPIIFRRI